MELNICAGTAAGVCTGISLLALLLTIYEKKKPARISNTMLWSLFAGLVLWIFYGFINHDWILIISNLVSLLIYLNFIYLNIRYEKQDRDPKLSKNILEP
jgi:MtN3 and saliva related transmembrane protein